MCGIAGVLSADSLMAEQAVRAMNRRQAHRGPDDTGLEVLNVPGGFLVLGHQRLSILDLSSAGHQPMKNPHTGDWIVYNGEVYNYPTLRCEMESEGILFRSQCDTEAILYCYARWGAECFDRLEGMFAIALYDCRRQRIVLARDPLGIKPLYYAVTQKGLVFSSELRAIEASGFVECNIDRRAVAGLLAYGSVPAPLTMFKGVRLLEPGVRGSIELPFEPDKNGSLSTTRFWNFPPPRAVSDRREAVIETRTRLEMAARKHLLSDVPVGVFLSSGLDSTAVATLCARMEPGSINTFTVSLADYPAIDENPIAGETARLIGTRHHSITLEDSVVRRLTYAWLNSIDQPSVDGLNTFIISGAVREQGIKVALSGLGGDEIFGGYSGFSIIPKIMYWGKIGYKLPLFVRSALAGMIFARKYKSQREKARELAQTAPVLRSIYFRLRRLFSDKSMRSLGFEPDGLELNEEFLLREILSSERFEYYDPEALISILESRFYMGNTLLRDADVCGMAHGLEIRVPLLDRVLVDYVYSLPGKWRVRRKGVNKPLLVEALGVGFRPEILALGKRGFSLPIEHWMTGHMRPYCEHLLQRTCDCAEMEPSAVKKVWSDFLSEPNGPAWSRAWLLVVLGAWYDKWDKTGR